MSQPYEIDSSRMPVVLGSALRVPSYAYANWGIPAGSNREESDKQYEIEWKGGSPNQMKYVIEAITATGLGNYSQMLRDENARLVAKIVRDSKEQLNYLEAGAGASTFSVYKKLKDDGLDLDKLYGTLIEPSQKRLDTMIHGDEKTPGLESLDLKEGKNFQAYAMRDIDVAGFVADNSQNIVSCVAQIHHHAYLDTPFRCLYNTLKPNGIIIITDWHNSMWEHPNRVYEFLKNEFEWSTKDADLDAFVRAYPKALEQAPTLSELGEGANRHIKKFWKGWEAVRKREIERGNFKPEDDIFMLEAHRPVEQQVGAMVDTGFVLPTHVLDWLIENPKQLVPDAGILYVTVGQKIV
jgi:SAM-dependent methyltransferase